MKTSQREKELLLEIEKLKYMVQLEEKKGSHKKEKTQFEKDYDKIPTVLAISLFIGLLGGIFVTVVGS